MQTKTAKQFSQLSDDAKKRVVNEHRDINVRHHDGWCQPILANNLPDFVDIGAVRFNLYHNPSIKISHTGVNLEKACNEWVNENVKGGSVHIDDVYVDLPTIGYGFVDFPRRAWKSTPRHALEVVRVIDESRNTVVKRNDEGAELYAHAVEALDDVHETLIDSLKDTFEALQDEYEYQTSYEAVVETLKANEYRFNADTGEIVG